MSNDKRLREQAREAIAAGKIPARAPQGTWGGPGSGAQCAICGKTVGREEIEFELQFAREAHDPDPEIYRLHIRCLAAWERERRANVSGAATDPSKPAGTSFLALPEPGGTGIMPGCDEREKNERERA
jgi:hypothetical protein